VSFLAPGLLLGTLAVAIPIALHFLYKPRHRKLPWAAMEFLRKSLEQTSKRLKFQEWILLALRCLALLLLALALARPSKTSSGSGGRGEAVDAIFVFDTSYSMAARDGEATRLDRAKAAAVAVLDNLPPNSTIQIIANSDRATALGPVSPRNVDQAKQIVAALDVTSQSSDVLPAITAALAALDRAAGSQKEVYFFTDLQKAGFERQAGAVRAKAEELKQRATVLVVRCGDPTRTPANAVLADLTFPGGIPHTGARMPFTAVVKNNGNDPIRNLTVTLEVDGKSGDKESEVVAEIPPGGAVPVTLTAKLDEAGPRVVTARLTGDELPGDNRLDRVVPVRDVVKVLVVDGAPDTRDPREAGSHFVANALRPVAANRYDDYFVKVTVVPADEAGPGLLGACDVCILCDVPASNVDQPGVAGLTAEFTNRLLRFVKDGGGLIVGLGDHVQTDRYNLLLGSRGTKLLPFDLGPTRITKADQPLKLATDSVAAGSFVERFKDSPFSTVTADVDVTTAFELKENPDGRSLMRFVDGTPAIASKAVGEGEVLLLATTLDARWSNWPAKAGSYVSLVQFALAHLTGKGTQLRNRVAGEAIVYQPPAEGAGFDVVLPGGKKTRLAKPGLDGQGKLTVAHTETATAGIYAIEAVGDQPMTVARYAVVPDLRESDDLTGLSDADVTTALGFAPMMLQAGTGDERQIATERSRREWTIGVLLTLFAIAVAEAVWAWRCGKAW
jgi:hypothetical protein